MSNITKLPAFGELLNAGIQTIKNLSTRNTIGRTVFYREFEKVAQIVTDHKEINFMSHHDIRNEAHDGSSCYEQMMDVVVLCLAAMGLVKEAKFSLIPNLNQNFANFITL